VDGNQSAGLCDPDNVFRNKPEMSLKFFIVFAVAKIAITV
jgi:hypothetical protein